LHHVEPLLCNDRKMGGYTRAVSRQWLRKHISVTKQQILNNATVGLQQCKSCVFYVVVPRCYKQGTRLDPVSSVRESVKKALEHGKLKNLHC
jgi:hypothetical protein